MSNDPLTLQQHINQLRHEAQADAVFFEVKQQLKLFQNKRLEITHQALVEDSSTRVAARFFLDKLYGVGPTHQRDQQVERVLPKAQKYLPSSGVEVLRQVIYMDWLAETMDTHMTTALLDLGHTPEQALTKATYLRAFLEVGDFDRRREQIGMVSVAGGRLVSLMRFPLLKSVLSMTRGAAHKANLEDFHEFLEEGVSAFKTLSKPSHFFQTIETEEKNLLNWIESRRIDEIPEKFFGPL